MLYDPKREYNPWHGLRAWLALQPADGTYAYYYCDNCVVGRYLEAIGGRHGNYNLWLQQSGHQDWAWKAFGPTYNPSQTYGGALKNLDALLCSEAREGVKG